MSESGKCKRNRKHRGNRRKNKNKEAACPENRDVDPVTDSEDIRPNPANQASSQPVNNVAKNLPSEDKEREIGRNPPEKKSHNEERMSDLDTIWKKGLTVPSEADCLNRNVSLNIVTENDPSSEPLSDSEKLRLENYRVDFPKLPKVCNDKKKLQNNKSKSLDNDDDLEFNIVDITECDVKSDDDKFAESNAIISEAESDVEWEVADELLDNNKKCFHKIKGQLSVETIPLQKADAEEVNSLSPEDELNLRNFLQSLNLSATSSNPSKIPAEVPDIVVEEEQKEEKESENDIKLRRARNKAALEEHFLPQIVNPRFLDVIDEEGSSESSDTTRRQSFLNENRELHQRFEDIDDDVFIAEKKVVKEPKDVFPKNKDYFASKKELKRQQECLLVGAKILESAVEEGCGDWTIEKVEEQRGADIVFLDDSSSSASEIDNGGETDFINDDERVTIKTPTIDFDCQFSDTETKIPPSTMLQNNKEYFDTKSIDSHNSVDEKEKNTNDDKVSTCSRPPNAVLSSNDEISESLESLLVLPPTPAACNEVTIMANEFVDEHSTDAVVLNEFVEKSVDIKHDNTKIVENEISNNLNPSGEEMSDHSSKDYSRHDSSSSVCSSHSTSHSTAKYNPQSSSLTDIAALVHDDLQSVPEPLKADIHENNSVGSFAITKTNRFMNVPGIEDNTNETILNHSDDPVSLKEICLTKVASLPLSDAVLEELVSVSENLNILTRHVRSERESKKFSQQEQTTTMPFFPSPDLSAVKKAAFAYKNSKLPRDLQSEKLPPPVNPRQSSFKVLREDPPWVGLASQADPAMLACLSPSQKSQIELTKNTTNDEAAELIDMHCKYAERRGYHETSASAEKPPPASNNIDDRIPVHASGGDGRAACSPGSANRLLAIIRDPQVSSDAKQNTADKQNTTDKQSPPHSTFDFMETLRSFEDLNTNLAKQEKNMSISKRSDSIKESLEISESYSSNQSYKANVRKGSSDEIGFTRNPMHFSEYSPVNTRLSVKEEYNSSDKNKSSDNTMNHSKNTKSENKYYYNSMGNLNSQEDTNAYVQRYHNKRAFLLDDPIFDSLSNNARQNKTSHSSKNVVPPRRSSLPKEFHDRQIAYIIQKEKEIEEQIKQLEEQKRFTNFERRRVSSGPRAPMIKDDNFPAENYTASRQRDIAIIQQEMDDQYVSSVSKTERPLLSVSAPSNGEKFRDQMYSEYMDKVAEREERKHQKVIKISNSQDCSSSSNTINEIKQACNKIEEEFISKAKLRWDKLGFKDPETEDENETDTAPKNEKDSLIATENQPVVIEHKIKVIEGDEEKDVQKLPNHLQEFVKFTSSGDEAEIVMIAPTFKAKGSSSGVWSPGGSTSHPSPSFNTKTSSSGNPPFSASVTQNGNSLSNKAASVTNTSKSVSSLSESFEHRTTVLNDSRKVTSSFENGVISASSGSSSVPTSGLAPASSSAPVKNPSPSGNPPPPPPPPLPVWKPRSQPPSPAQEKKEFKPVTFESPTLARKNLQQEQTKSEAPPPWESRLAGSRSAPAAPGLSGLAAPPTPPPPPPPPSLPRAQNPTITLLQKAREGQLPRGAAYLQQDREREPPRDRRSPPRTNQGEVVYTLRREYASDTETSGSRRRMAEPKKYDGIGPTTKEGMPIVLRSEVKEGNQTKWYKKMYDTIHRNKFDDDYVTVKYKSRRAHPSVLHPGPRTTQYAYFDPRSGYLSEPEGGRAGWASDAYDSDASAKLPGRRHSTLDRRGKENEVISEYLPSNTKYSTLASAKASQEVYKNQPGRIEDYVPGRSSVVDKEAKQWWDEVMDIFDGQLANTSVQQPQMNNKQSVSSSALSKSYMARAFKESGYESDSTLVFRRRGVNGGADSAPLSPREQRQAYREVQAGGEPPLHGFRKPAPDRPKESPRRYVESDVNIHYRVPVRQEPRPLVPEEELARRQADHMRRVYQEERRRKYLQELQDMNSRRHTDNFTPAQKSPIPLNRYDTFGSTGQLRPHQVARALHNFTGQSPRELSFRKGDLILVRRRIDHNWFEGEYDGQVGLFPSNYVELIDNEAPLTPSQPRPSEGRARAKFNFLAHTHLELGLKKGELVTLTRRVDENWYEGKLGGRKGIFPVSYVEVLVEPQPNRSELAPSLSTGKPVASPAAHSVVGAAGTASLGAHHYTPQLNNPALSNSPSSTAPLTLPSHGITNHHARPASATLPRAADPSPVNLNNHEPLYRAMYKYRPQNPDELELQEGDTVYVLEKCDDGWYVGSSQRTGRFGTFPGNYVEKI